MPPMHDALPDFDRLWDYDKPRETEQTMRALLPGARGAGNAAYLAELLTQIARTQALQREFAAAQQTLDEAEAVLPSDQPQPHVRYLLERGRVFNSSGHKAQARDFFLRAWQLAGEQGLDFYAVDAAHMMAIAESAERQLEWNLRALGLAERSAEARARNWRGSLHNNIGWTHHDQGRYAEALTHFRLALACRQEQGLEREVRIATWCVARALRSLGRVEQALELQQELLVQCQAAGDADGYISEELGECLLSLGHRDEARGHFARAYAVLSQDPWLAAEDAARLQRLKELSA